MFVPTHTCLSPGTPDSEDIQVFQDRCNKTRAEPDVYAYNPNIWRSRNKNHKFEPSLGYIARSYLSVSSIYACKHMIVFSIKQAKNDIGEIM